MIRHHRRSPSCMGFSLVELLVAMTVALLVTASVFAMLDPAAGAFQTQPEAADVQQRLRVATDVLYRDLLIAGGGPTVAPGSNTWGQLAAAVLPLRIGRRSADPAGTFDPGRITVWSVSPAAPQTTLASPLSSASGTATLNSGPGCREGDQTCGFRSGMTVAVFGPSGIWDLFSVTGVIGNALTLQHNLRDSALTHNAGEAIVAEVTVRTYFLRDEPGSGVARLMRYDGAGGADVPVVDHVVGLQFQYLGEAEPPAIVVGTGVAEPQRVTYGPLPPDVGVTRTGYSPGENCAFGRTGGGALLSRLEPLAAGPVLVPLAASALTDGPWCPDAASPNRYDADLLRVRQVIVTVTVEAAVAALRGPAGPLFTRSGTARGTRQVPDRVARLAVAPRALNAVR